MPQPRIRLQTGSLYASNDESWFTGTGGPWGFSPYTSQFGGVVSSAGLAGEPFEDVLHNVAAGDEVIFVVALENLGDGAARDVRVRVDVPAGFVAPADGIDLSATDGAGDDLAVSGDLFGAAGLTLGPVAAYDPASGRNLALVTYTLVAGPGTPVPDADLRSVARLLHVAASAGGPDLSGGTAPASTTVLTAAPTPIVTAVTDPGAVARGQLITFDVAVPIPQGTLRDLRLDTLLPGGAASLSLIAVQVAGVGGGLQSGVPVVGGDGSVRFGTVTNAASGGDAATITLRLVLRAEGTVSGAATVRATLSAADPDQPGARWSAGVASTVGVVVPPPPPVIDQVWTSQTTVPGMVVRPFGALRFAAADSARPATLAITMADGAAGQFNAPGTGSLDASGRSFIATGILAALQAAARSLTFTAGGSGTARFIVTLIDENGGVAQDGTAGVVVLAPGTQSSPDPLFDVAYYLRENPDVAITGVDPYQQFMTQGWREGRNPDAYFDVGYYLAQNGDVRAAGLNPLMHFETYGWRENRNPSASFSNSTYLAQNPDVAAARINPLYHYLQYGRNEGRPAPPTGAAPSGAGASHDVLVDDDFVAGQVPSIDPATLDVDRWFHQTGSILGVNPGPWFDSAYYLAQNPDVRAAHIDPLLHFDTYGWREGRDPSLMFSAAKYLASNLDVLAVGVDPLLHYMAYGRNEGRAVFLSGGTAAVDPLVDAAFYDRQVGASLIPTGPAADAQAAWSYDATGWRRGLDPNAWFDTDYYLAHNADVAAAHINPLLHYENYGWREGRDPSAAFSTNRYLAANADVRAAGLNPLVHYVTAGQAEGRPIYAP